MKRSSIAEHLVNSPNCAKNYNKTILRILKIRTNLLDLIKLEVILIQLNKLKLCKYEVFN